MKNLKKFKKTFVKQVRKEHGVNKDAAKILFQWISKEAKPQRKK